MKNQARNQRFFRDATRGYSSVMAEENCDESINGTIDHILFGLKIGDAGFLHEYYTGQRKQCVSRIEFDGCFWQNLAKTSIIV